MATLNVAILGASGYTGVDLIRLLSQHPQVRIAALAAQRSAGKDIRVLFPSLLPLALPMLQAVEDIDYSAIDAVFCCLPHAATQEAVASIPDSVVVIDLSADFRLSDIPTYEKWYGEHKAKHLQAQAVYGLTEWARDAVKKARLIANPGCYPTSTLLPLIPLLKARLICEQGIIIDSKSGVSGAGRALREGSLAAEVQEGFKAYGVDGHRHLPEIEQGLSEAASAPIHVTFTPHLLPMNRGILSTIYAELADTKTLADVNQVWQQAYDKEPFVHVVPVGAEVSTRYVRGTNHCMMQAALAPNGKLVIVSALDNLVKGASGQAVQNFNARFGIPETTALQGVAMYP